METTNNNNANNSQGGQQKQAQQGFDLSGLDLSGLFPPGTWEAIKPFLSSGVMAGGIYLFLIKPLKDKVELQDKRIGEMKDRLDSQKDYILDLETRLEKIERNVDNLNGETEKKSGLFGAKRHSHHSSSQSSNTHDYRKRGLNL